MALHFLMLGIELNSEYKLLCIDAGSLSLHLLNPPRPLSHLLPPEPRGKKFFSGVGMFFNSRCPIFVGRKTF